MSIVFKETFVGPAGKLPTAVNYNISLGNGSDYGIVGWGNNEIQYYVSDATKLDGAGNLVIESKKLASPIVDSNWTSTWSSGKITTQNKLLFFYGTIEVVVKMPTGAGNGFAIWMLGYDYPNKPWPNTGEIDIIEYFSRNNPKLISVSANSTNTIVGGNNYPPYNPGEFKNKIYNTKNIDVRNTFNTYRIDWDTNGITWYFNGTKIHQVLKSNYTFQGNNYDYPFDKPFYLIINNSIGGDAGGTVDPKMTSSKSYIKSITYKKLNKLGDLHLQTYQLKSPWSHFRGIYSTNNGFSPYEGPKSAIPKIYWEYITNNVILSTPTIDENGNKYFGCDNGILYCLDSLGKIKWKTQAVPGLIRNSPTISKNGNIYVATVTFDEYYNINTSFDGTIYCYKPNGTLFKQTKIGSSIFSSISILPNGNVIVAACDGFVYCFDQNLLTQIWKIQISASSNGSYIYSTPTIGADGNIYIGSYDGNVYAISSGGEQIWKCYLGNNGQRNGQDVPVKIYSTCAIHNNILYVSANNGNFYAIETVTSNTNIAGRIRWSYNTDNRFTYALGSNAGDSFGSPAIGPDGSIYFTNWRGRYGDANPDEPDITNLYALTPGGQLKWVYAIRENLNAQTQSSPIVDKNSTIYIATQNGYILALKDNGNTSSELFNIRVSDTAIYGSLSIDNNGILYIGTIDRKLIAVSDYPSLIVKPTIFSCDIGIKSKNTIELINLIRNKSNVKVEVYINAISAINLKGLIQPLENSFIITHLLTKKNYNIILKPYIETNNVKTYGETFTIKDVLTL